MTRMAGFNDWDAFLRPLASAVRNPPTRDDYRARCAACADILAIPAEWLTQTRRRDAAGRFDFWPSVAEIGAVFDADKRHAMALRGFADPGDRLPPPEPPRRPTPEQIEDNRAKVAALKADLAEAMTKDSPKATPRHLTPQQLRAAYELLAAQGSPFARARLETL